MFNRLELMEKNNHLKLVKSVRPPGVRDTNHVKFPSRCFWFDPAAVTDHPTRRQRVCLAVTKTWRNLAKPCSRPNRPTPLTLARDKAQTAPETPPA